MITNYFFDGGPVTTSLVTQGEVVPSPLKRKISGAVVCNDTGGPLTFTAVIVGSAGATPVTLISARTIIDGESYVCQELIGRGMNTGGYIQVSASGAGMDFKYEAFNISNG